MRLLRISILSALAVSLTAPDAAAQAARPEQGQLDASPALFTVLAALNAAGYDAELDSPNTHSLRHQVRKALAARRIASLEPLKRFLAVRRPAELGPYVSFALATDGPPEFRYRFQRHELPPDVVPLDGLAALLEKFHREAGLDELWQKAQPAFEQAIARYQEPASRALLGVNGYMRNPTSGYLGRRFQVYIDLLGAPNQIHTRSYADDYFVVLTPSAEPQVGDIRHAYMHYLLDPLATKHSAVLEKKRALADYALGAALLEDHYKQDFLLLAAECLIKAVESRLAGSRTGPALVEQALREGFILTPYFAEQLPLFEKQDQAMRLYFPDLIEAIDLKKEEGRLANLEFTSQRAVRKAKVAPAPPAPEPTGPEKTAEEAENFYRDRDLAKARQAYLRLLQETAEKSFHAKAYYGLARIAALEKNPELAEKLFLKTIELEGDAQTRAWSQVYLGRLAHAAGEPERAAGYFRAALAVEGASAAARQAAEQGLGAGVRKNEE